jgi:transglutaminase-like putative cysteine protease
MDNNPLADYLIEDEIINWRHPAVREQAGQLAQGAEDKVELSRRCFTFVRDRIAHSMDIGAEAVTCSASEVLLNGHGICYAKSHLLAALLRANGIPSGFSYQRLSDENGGYCLHGFNSLYLPSHGWYRVDARGNKAGVDAQFIPPHEQLAFSHSAPGECDYGLNLAAPLPCVVRVLQCSEAEC